MNKKTIKRVLHGTLQAAFAIVLTTSAFGETVQIAGPKGPLAAEMISVDSAENCIVIIPGSGPTNRDGNAPQMGLRSNTYKMLAEELAAKGIASLRIDKRGLFGSHSAISDPNNVTIADYARDVRNWVVRAAEMAPCVWIAGHSEGGLVALVAAQEPPRHLCGVILLATSGRPLGQLMREQMRAVPGNAALLPDLDETVAELEAGRRRDPQTLPPALQPMFRSNVQNYLIDVFSYDPVVVARDWKGPALIIQGNADIQVKPRDADLLEAALPQADRVDLLGATHMLKRNVPGQLLLTYKDPSLPLHPRLVNAIKAFIHRN